MSVIALLTDFGNKDEYVGVIKGVIFKINPEVKIVDLSHEIPPQDLVWASYSLASSYQFFPKGTIFLSVVDPGVGTKRKIIILKTKDYLFVSPDNGILTKVLEREKPEEIIEVKNREFFLKEISFTFHGRDIMAPVVGYLSKGIELSKFGPPLKKITYLKIPKPRKMGKRLIGEIIHIDHFGNLTTNIERKWNILSVEIKGRRIPKINQSYAESKKGELLAIFGSRNLLEISINLGSAERELGIKKGEKVIVELSG